jgi:hypothetical protein
VGGRWRRRCAGIGGRAVDADFTLLIGRVACRAAPVRGRARGTVTFGVRGWRSAASREIHGRVWARVDVGVGAGGCD